MCRIEYCLDIHLNYGFHLCRVDRPIPVNVVHRERPIEFVLRIAFVAGDVDGKQKLLGAIR